MEYSKKFKLIFELAQNSLFTEYVPKFHLIDQGRNEFDSFFKTSKEKYILRSSLWGEGGDYLYSGKSKSISNIINPRDLKIAFKKIYSQLDIDKVILQEQFDYEIHITLVIKDDFCFVEAKNDGPNIHKIVIGGSYILGEAVYLPELKRFLKIWKTLRPKGYFILELGIKNSELKLFQAISIPEDYVFSLFSDSTLHSILSHQKNYKNKTSLFPLLKKEWDAYKFRKSDFLLEEYNIGDAFGNWYFLLHYFTLFCKLKSLNGSDQNFIDFLNYVNSLPPNWIKSVVMKHIQISEKIRKKKKNSLSASSFSDKSSQPYFIGNGVFEGVIKNTVVLIENPTPDQMYSLSMNKPVLTPCSSILGHSTLIAVERNIPLIANIPAHLWESIDQFDKVFLDFHAQKIVIN